MTRGKVLSRGAPKAPSNHSMGLKLADLIHRTAVVGLAGTAAYATGFIFVRLRDVRAKSKEVEDCALSNGITLEEAAVKLGYRNAVEKDTIYGDKAPPSAYPTK